MINVAEKEKSNENAQKSAKKSEPDSNKSQSQSFHIDPDSAIKSRHEPKYHVKLTTGARKIVDEEQAKMLVNMIAHEFTQRPHLNVFTFDKVGLIIIKNGFSITILTKDEKDTMSRAT